MTISLTWLIATNIFSEMMRPRPAPQVAVFLDSIADERIGLASVTIWEVLDGIWSSGPWPAQVLTYRRHMAIPHPANFASARRAQPFPSPGLHHRHDGLH